MGKISCVYAYIHAQQANDNNYFYYEIVYSSITIDTVALVEKFVVPGVYGRKIILHDPNTSTYIYTYVTRKSVQRDRKE